MVLRQTRYGGECPLGKFEIDVAAGGGCYTSDPVEACLRCNFADISLDGEDFDPSKICQCPEGMTWGRYDGLRKRFFASDKEKTKLEFRKFVGEQG